MRQVNLDTTTSTVHPIPGASLSVSDWGQSATEKAHSIGPSTICSTESVGDDLSYTIKLRNLIGRIMVQLNEIAKNDRNSVEDLKKRYFTASHSGADLGRTAASQNLKFAIFTMIAGAVLTNVVQQQAYKDIATSFARDVSPRIGEMFVASTHADKQKQDGLASMLVNQFQMEGQKGQNASTAKQELLGILRELLDSLKSSTRG